MEGGFAAAGGAEEEPAALWAASFSRLVDDFDVDADLSGPR